MKKRVTSSGSLRKSDKQVAGVVQIDLKKQHKQQTHKHHSRCPLPKPQRADTPAHKHTAVEIKELKSPILNELRSLISNFVGSSDRILEYVQAEDYKHSFKIYHEDRRKLLQYLNSLIIKPVDIAQVKARLQTPKNTPNCQQHYYASSKDEASTQEQIGREVQEMRAKVDKALQRQRSKSTAACLQTHLHREVSIVQNRIDELEKRSNAQANLQEYFASQMKLYNKYNSIHPNQILPNNPESSENLGLSETDSLHAQLTQSIFKNESLSLELSKCKAELEGMKGRLVYIELLLFKCGHLLRQHFDEESEERFTVQREKVNLLVNTLAQTAQYLHSQSDSPSDVMQKLKQEAQSMVLYLSELRKRSLEMLKDKQRTLQELREERKNSNRDQSQLEGLRIQIKRLNDDVVELIQETNKKDEQMQALREENLRLRNDLKDMETHVEQVQRDYQNLCQEAQFLNEKLKNSDALLQARQEQFAELLSEIQVKDVQIHRRMRDLEVKQLEISRLKVQISFAEQAKAQLANSGQIQLNLQSGLLQLKQLEVDELKAKIATQDHENKVLSEEKQMLGTLREASDERVNNLELKVQALENQNEQLYKDLRESEFNQWKLEENSLACQLLYKELKKECSAFREQIIENHKKIRFYEEKLVELAQLADERIVAAIQEEFGGQTPAHPPDAKEHGCSPTFLEQIEEESGEAPSFRSEAANNHQFDDYIPFLLQNSPRSSHSNRSNHELLKVSRNDDLGQAGKSALSHYDIFVVDENLDTIDSHKAVCPKQASNIKIVDEEESLKKSLKSLSNIAERSDSAGPPPRTEETSTLPRIYLKEQTEKSIHEMISPKIGNVIETDSLKASNLEAEIEKHDVLSNLQQIPGMKVSESVDTNKVEQRQIDQFLFKNVDMEQVIKAELRLSGEREPAFLPDPKYHTEKKNRRQRSSDRNGNVYIRMKKENSTLSSVSGREQRSKSCFQNNS